MTLSILAIGDSYLPATDMARALESLADLGTVRYETVDIDDRPELEGVHEYQGSPEAVTGWLREDDVLVVHAAPIYSDGQGGRAEEPPHVVEMGVEQPGGRLGHRPFGQLPQRVDGLAASPGSEPTGVRSLPPAAAVAVGRDGDQHAPRPRDPDARARDLRDPVAAYRCRDSAVGVVLPASAPP